MRCAACNELFTTANSCKDGEETTFTTGMLCICVHCGTILRVVSPAESRIADSEIDDIPQEAYDIAFQILTTGR